MLVRMRNLVDAIMLIVLVVTWALLAMVLAQWPFVKANGDDRSGLLLSLAVSALAAPTR